MQQSSEDVAFCRHQERGDSLLIENARLGQDLETQKLNLADINEFLTSELEASGKKLRQIEEKATALQQQVDDIKEIHTVRISPCWQLYFCSACCNSNPEAWAHCLLSSKYLHSVSK